MVHKPLSPEELESVSGYLESVQNLAKIARLLIKEKQLELLFTVLEEICVNTQTIYEYCEVKDD